MDFLNLQLRYLLIFIPLLSLAGFLIYKIYRKNKIFDTTALAKMRDYDYSKSISLLKYIFLTLCLAALFLAVLRPAWGVKKSTIEAKGTDVVFTLDVSQSMKALDLSQNGSTISRLDAAKAMIASFISNHPENRYGLVIFAGEAFVSTPLTMDSSAFLTFLDGVDYNDVGTQGTDIGEALKASIDRFYSEQDKERGRSIVVISDGGEEAANDTAGFAKVAGQLGISIFTIGIGSTKGVPIPENTDYFGRVNYKEYQGRTVMTKLNEQPLKDIAAATGGQYFHAEKTGDLEKISRKLATLEATTLKSEAKAGREDRYQYFLLAAFLLFVFYLLIDNGLSEAFRKRLKGVKSAGEPHFARRISGWPAKINLWLKNILKSR